MLESLFHSSVAAYNHEKLANSFSELKSVVSATFHTNATNNDATKHLFEKGCSLGFNSVILWHVASSSSCCLCTTRFVSRDWSRFSLLFD